jgi:hypothetical protein
MLTKQEMKPNKKVPPMLAGLLYPVVANTFLCAERL